MLARLVIITAALYSLFLLNCSSNLIITAHAFEFAPPGRNELKLILGKSNNNRHRRVRVAANNNNNNNKLLLGFHHHHHHCATSTSNDIGSRVSASGIGRIIRPSFRLSYRHHRSCCCHYSILSKPSPSLSSLSSSISEDDSGRKSSSDSDNDKEKDKKCSPPRVSKGRTLSMILKFITLYAPIWTLCSAILGVTKSQLISPTLGSLSVMQKSLALLMLAMGLTLTPRDVSRTLKQPSLLLANALLCYGLMPLVAFLLSSAPLSLSAPFFNYNTSEAAGIIVLGCVSGGQASNLFTLLAGGDVALSVICTFTTTILGVVATPLLIQYLLGHSVETKALEVLLSVVQLSLIPLLMGLGLGRLAPRLVSRVVPYCPALGVLATLVLVAGGAANSAAVAVSAATETASGINVSIARAVTASCALPIIGGGLALALLSLPVAKKNCTEKSKRALVIETFSKSPTLATVLAKRHFDGGAAAVPAAAMVSLAVIGAVVSTLWSCIWPTTDGD